MKECPWCEGDGWVPENSVLPASRNNFLKALEALKAEHAESCIVLAAGVPEADAIRCCGTCALIKELEEIECSIEKSR